MQDYISVSVSKSQVQFAQIKPLNYCRKCRSNIELSRNLIGDGKIAYIIKCRDPRCSHECRIKWSRKQSSIINIFLRDDLPIGCRVYRGNLTMRRGATPNQHATAKKAFLRTMKRWTNRHNCIFEIHATMHITDPNNAHWDIIAYSNASKTKLGKAVSAAWSRAGGKSHSLPLLDLDEIAAATRYASKDERVNKERKSNRRYLALPTRELGLNVVWHTSSFFQGQKPADLWRKQIQEWKDAGVFCQPASNNCVPTLEPKVDAENPVQSPVQEAIQVRLDALKNDPENGSKVSTQLLDATAKQALLAELDRLESELPRRNSSNVVAVLPESPRTATEAASLGGWADVPSKVAASILEDAQRTTINVKKIEETGPIRHYWNNGRPSSKPSKVVKWYRNLPSS